MARSNTAFKDKSIEEKRGIILDAAWKLFQVHGYKKVSVDDIARKIRVSKGAIYLYFNSKEELFKGVIELNLKSPMDRAREIAANSNLPIDDKLTKVIIVKIGAHHVSLYESSTIIEIVEDAFHIADELMQQDGADFQAIVTSMIKEAVSGGEISLKHSNITSKDLARIIIYSAHGLARYGEYIVPPDIFNIAVKRLVKILVAGLK